MAPLDFAGHPLSWDEAVPHLRDIRRRGVQQFVKLYKLVEGTTGAELLWGDEVEYHIMRTEASGTSQRSVKLSLRAAELLKQLEACENNRGSGCSWHAEYGAWMVEATPREPYGGYSSDIMAVEASLRLRRRRLLSLIQADELIPTIPTFPLMGVGSFTDPAFPNNGPAAKSAFVPDELINGHPRFATLTANIRERRGEKVDIRLPLYEDVATPEFKVAAPDKPPVVTGDAMAFGMGSCCLQVRRSPCPSPCLHA